MSSETSDFAFGPSTIRLGDLEVRRLGYGAMQLPGEGVWGEPKDPERARAVLRRVVELGVNLIDTAWFYGPHVSNRLLAEVLHPYPAGLVLATKLGGKRLPDKSWAPALRPEELREGCEEDLRSLRLERLDVVHLRYRPHAGVPFLECLDAMLALQREGKIRHLALSAVDAALVEQALARTPIVAVQNMYTLPGAGGALARYTHSEVSDPEAVLALCEARGIAYLPYFPLAAGQLGSHDAASAVAKKRGVSRAQVALAWLLARSKVMLPIPGTSAPAHLEDNWAARKLELTPEELASLG